MPDRLAPFHRTTELPTLWAHVHDEPPGIADALGLPGETDKVLARGLAKRPEHRHPSCALFVEDLEHAAAPVAVPDTPRRRRGAGMALAAALCVALAAGAGALVWASGDDEPVRQVAHTEPPPPPARAGPNTAVLFDADTGELLDDVPLSGPPALLVASGDRAWAAGDGQAWLRPLKESAPDIQLPSPATALAAGPGGVWIAMGMRQKLAHLTHGDLRDGGPIARGTAALAMGASELWIGGPDGVKGPGPEAATDAESMLAVLHSGDDTSLWMSDGWTVSDQYGTDIWPPESDDTGRISSIAAGYGAVWAAVPEDGVVYRIDSTGTAIPYELGDRDRPSIVRVARGQVWVADADAGTVWRIDPEEPGIRMQTLTVDGRVADLAISDAGIWVGVASPTIELTAGLTFARGGDIWSREPGQDKATRLLRANARDGTPSWSPDRLRLLFSRGRPEQQELYVLNTAEPAADRRATRLSGTQEGDTSPVYDPAARAAIYFTRHNSENESQIYTLRDGIAERYIYDQRDFAYHASPSPTGHWIAYAAASQGITFPQVRVRHGLSGVVHGKSADTAPAGPPAWSPDGTTLAFWSGAGGSGYICLAYWDLDVSRVERLIQVPISKEKYPHLPIAWSPDGRLLAYSVRREGRQEEVHVIRADGTGDRVVEAGSSPAWRPLPLNPLAQVTS